MLPHQILANRSTARCSTPPSKPASLTCFHQNLHFQILSYSLHLVLDLDTYPCLTPQAQAAAHQLHRHSTTQRVETRGEAHAFAAANPGQRRQGRLIVVALTGLQTSAWPIALAGACCGVLSSCIARLHGRYACSALCRAPRGILYYRCAILTSGIALQVIAGSYGHDRLLKRLPDTFSAHPPWRWPTYKRFAASEVSLHIPGPPRRPVLCACHIVLHCP